MRDGSTDHFEWGWERLEISRPGHSFVPGAFHLYDQLVSFLVRQILPVMRHSTFSHVFDALMRFAGLLSVARGELRALILD